MKTGIKLFILFSVLATTLLTNVFSQDKKIPDADFVLKSEFTVADQLHRAHVPEYSFQTLNTYPHDSSSFTEGLCFEQGILYESTGLYGFSHLRKGEMNGRLIRQIPLSSRYFGEGMTILGDKAYQLTYREHTGFIYDKQSFALRQTFTYAGEGWGLTTDGKQLIMSNGSSTLTWLDPVNLGVVRTLTVTTGKSSLSSLNELEYIDHLIYANVWPTSIIVIISPENGKVLGFFDIKSLKPSRKCPDCVANGIAWNEQDRTIYVTGKNWPSLYAIKVFPPHDMAS